MDTNDNNEVYDYDKCLFFRLLQSSKYAIKLEFIQQHQGVVVCPICQLQLKNNNKEITDLIDSHLFLPSPFYKNHYIPLNSLSALSSLASSNCLSSLSLDHSQQINLILSEDENNELCLMSFRRRICKNVKLLNVQTAFTENYKKYKILIVDNILKYKRQSNFNKVILNGYSTSKINKDEIFDDQSLMDLLNEDSETHNKISDDLVSYNENFSLMGNFLNINDVNTYRQSIDFMQTNLLTFNNFDSSSSNEDEENTYKKRKISQKSLIGASLLNEIEVFRKTYIILSNHLEDCLKNLLKIYKKYIKMFFKSIKTNNICENSENYDLIIIIACENTIIGFLFTKLWPCILETNSEKNERISMKFKQLTNYLKLNDLNNNEESFEICSKFFNINKNYFRINQQPIQSELKNLSLVNVPFEKLECIKKTIDSVTNELTILLAIQKEQTFITSEILIPLLAFILIKSNLNCVYSVIYFVEKFQLSSYQNIKSINSTKLEELAYFMTTFRAAIQFIETSQI